MKSLYLFLRGNIWLGVSVLALALVCTIAKGSHTGSGWAIGLSMLAMLVVTAAGIRNGRHFFMADLDHALVRGAMPLPGLLLCLTSPYLGDLTNGLAVIVYCLGVASVLVCIHVVAVVVLRFVASAAR